jgi:hypothetical protein
MLLFSILRYKAILAQYSSTTTFLGRIMPFILVCSSLTLILFGGLDELARFGGRGASWSTLKMVLFWVKHTTQIGDALVRYHAASTVAPGRPNLRIEEHPFSGGATTDTFLPEDWGLVAPPLA